MLIRKLLLTNYGLFAGRQEFDLAPRSRGEHHRPIILFGGMNGAGKTTILEAIRVSLYGRLALGSRIRQLDYTAFLRSRVHRGSLSGLKPSQAGVAIEFDHVHRGELDRYVVDRSWRHVGKEDIEETLVVTKNESPLEEVDSELWQSFVRDVIPEGLAQLFFFDGEKIQQLAENATGTGALADSIKSLLGLDLVERLDADLTVYSNRQVTQLGSSADQEAASRLQAEIAVLDAALADSLEELAALRTSTDGVHAELRRAEEHLRRDGEDLSRRRERLQGERVSIAAKIEAAERAIRDQCDHLFPLALCPKTARRLSQELKFERTAAQADQVRSSLTRIRSALLKSLRAKRSGKGALGAAGVAAATSAIEAVFKANMPTSVAAPLHALSEADARKVGSSLVSAKAQSAVTVRKLCADLVRWTARLEVIERSLAQIPADEVIAPRVEAIAALNRRLGALDRSTSDAEDRRKRQEIDSEQKKRELRRLTERYEQSSAAHSKIALARTVQSALSEYLRALTDAKVEQLRDAVAACFNRLSRKSDVVQRVDIDPQSFVVTLFDSTGAAVPKEELSSGEKQIFAIAMLWGLAKTSGRPLPVIIDTPLGRLDSDHRRKLIHDYLPYASHQVIVLSTDTEVDQTLFEELRTEISHAYHLSYLPEERRTRVTSGYFWRTPQELACST